MIKALQLIRLILSLKALKGQDLHVGKDKIEARNNFTYLGVKLTSDGGSSKEIVSRIGHARATTRQPNSLMWSKEIKEKK